MSTNVSVSEIVARALVVGEIRMQARVASSRLTHTVWARRVDAAEALLVEAMSERHVYTWGRMSEYRERAMQDVDEFLEETDV